MSAADFPDVNKGDRIFLIPRSNQTPRSDGFFDWHVSGTNGYGKFDPAVGYEVTRVTANYLWVRVPRQANSSYYWPGTETTIQIDRAVAQGVIDEESLARCPQVIYRLDRPEYVAPRKLGEKPEGDAFIGIDHPGLQWLWEDLGTYAARQHYCSEYDKLADGIGIPGRVREFTVSAKVGTLTVSAKLKARSKREAEEMLGLQLSDSINRG